MPPKHSILVVDDDPDVLAVLTRTLSAEGMHVDTAGDAEQARAMLAIHSFDVVVLDIVMPGESGLALLHELRQNGSRVKVVIMTAANTSAHLVGALREGAARYLSKPFSPKAALDIVKQAIDADEIFQDEIEIISARPQWISLLVRCRLEAAERLAQFFRELQMGLTPEQQENVVTAFRELLMNAIEHGCHLDANQKVRLSYIRTSRAVIYYIHDPGEGFSMENLPHAAVSNTPEAPLEHVFIRDRQGMRPGGFGILLTRQLCDDVIYNEKGNEVLLIKYLDPA
jgi:DNA-binding response OmpR family regulator